MDAEEKIRTKLQKHVGQCDEIWIDYDKQIKTLTKAYKHLYQDFNTKRTKSVS